MGSVEGTFVNGKRVNKGALAFGDEIRVGSTLIRLMRPGAQAEALQAAARKQTDGFFTWLEKQLGDREWFNGESFGWGDLSVVPYLNGSVGQGHPPPEGSKLAAWLARANARPSVQACVADIAALNAGASMPNVAELVEKGLFKREYRDHRLEWMIKSGGLEVVLKGLERDNIRFAPAFN
jgi:glutathione S-transferase/RNA polymerase-associated protein